LVNDASVDQNSSATVSRRAVDRRQVISVCEIVRYVKFGRRG